MSQNVVTIQRNSSGILKNRRVYPALIVAMTRALEQFANKASGYKNFSNEPVYNFPVLLVEGIGESDARRFAQYFSAQRVGLLLNYKNIYMKNNPIANTADNQTLAAVKKGLNQDKHAFAIIFHEDSSYQSVLKWIDSNLTCPALYRDNLLIQQKIRKQA